MQRTYKPEIGCAFQPMGHMQPRKQMIELKRKVVTDRIFFTYFLGGDDAAARFAGRFLSSV